MGADHSPVRGPRSALPAASALCSCLCLGVLTQRPRWGPGELCQPSSPGARPQTRPAYRQDLPLRSLVLRVLPLDPGASSPARLVLSCHGASGTCLSQAPSASCVTRREADKARVLRPRLGALPSEALGAPGAPRLPRRDRSVPGLRCAGAAVGRGTGRRRTSRRERRTIGCLCRHVYPSSGAAEKRRRPAERPRQCRAGPHTRLLPWLGGLSAAGSGRVRAPGTWVPASVRAVRPSSVTAAIWMRASCSVSKCWPLKP